jgi:hypothetical protein
VAQSPKTRVVVRNCEQFLLGSQYKSFSQVWFIDQIQWFHMCRWEDCHGFKKNQNKTQINK